MHKNQPAITGTHPFTDYFGRVKEVKNFTYKDFNPVFSRSVKSLERKGYIERIRVYPKYLMKVHDYEGYIPGRDTYTGYIQLTDKGLELCETLFGRFEPDWSLVKNKN